MNFRFDKSFYKKPESIEVTIIVKKCQIASSDLCGVENVLKLKTTVVD